MRALLLSCIIISGLNMTGYAQRTAYPVSGLPKYVTYFDLGIGTYGLDVAISGQPTKNWGGTLFGRFYPGPKGPLYSIDSPYIVGAELKYYDILPQGFFGGTLIAGEILPSFRPILGGVLGYDYFSRWFDRNQFNNLHISVQLEGGIDTEGEIVIGVGARIGFGFRNEAGY